jgi:outer membrane protein assembly factor BamB
MGLQIDLEKWDENPKNAVVASLVITVVIAIASVAALLYWVAANPSLVLTAEVPGLDGLPPGGGAADDKIDLVGVFKAFDGTRSDLPGEWRSFRGPNFDNIVSDGPALASSWPAEGPEILWSVEIGKGYAAPTILNGVVYLMDYDEERYADVLRAFSLETGEEIWNRSYALRAKVSHGVSRNIPAVSEKYIITIGPKCHVVCLDTETGEFLWGKDLQAEYGTKEPAWYSAQCAFIEGDTVAIAPSGPEVLMIGIDCKTGEVLWETPNPKEWDMSHASIVPMTILGKRMYVYPSLGGMSGVSAEGDDVGTLLWQIPWNATVVAPSPVQVGDDHIFMTAGYDSGNLMVKLSESGGTYTAEKVYAQEPGMGLSCEQQTPIYHNGLLYGILPKKAGGLRQQFVCFDPKGEFVWSSGSDNRFGLGPFLLADDKFYILDDHGMLTMLDATQNEYKQLGQAHILDGHDPWGPIAVADTRMFFRDMDRLICVEMGT